MRRYLFAAGLIALASPAIANDELLCANRGAPTPDDAIAACARIIASGTQKGTALAQVHAFRAASHRRKKDTGRAIADLDAAIRLDPEYAFAYGGRGFAYIDTGEYRRAIADFTEAIRLNPNYAQFYHSRGLAWSFTGDHDRAIVDISEALRIDPSNALYLRSRALSHAAKSDFDRATSDLQAAISRGLKDGNELLRQYEQKRAAAPQQSLVTAPQPSALAPVSAGPRVALVIGNGRYRHATPLINPANDAADIATALRKLGFEVIEGIDLDKRGMEDKIREFGRKLDRASLALFFYAGHGLQVGGKNYIVPVDSKLERPADLDFETLDIGVVLGQMEAEQRVNLIFLDACRDNPLSRSLARSMGTRSASIGSGLAQVRSALGTLIGYATQPDAVALDGDGRNSPFTTAMLRHLATPGLEISALMRRVRADVVQVTQGRQVPWDHSSLLGEVVLAR